MISTPRLTLLPLTQEQLNLLVHGVDQLEPTLGLRPSLREETEPLLGVLIYFTMPRLRDPINYPPLFNTLWIAVDNHRRQIVASAKFKGAPDETGTIEIGYGTYPVFQRRGYMTEMVQGMIGWAKTQPGIRRVIADTDTENVASQKVLEKCGFRMFDRVEEMLWYELEFLPLSMPIFKFDERGSLLSPSPIYASAQTIVATFAYNTHRQLLWRDYEKLSGLLSAHRVPILFCWLDGSFLTKKEFPNDIDIALFVPVAFFNSRRAFLETISQQAPSLDVKWIPLLEETSEIKKAINELEKMKWFLLFSSDREDKPKGLIEITQ